MKSLQAPHLKTIVLTKAMYTMIRSDVEEAFNNMSEESEKKKTLSLRNRCGLFQVKAWLSRPQKTWQLQTPARLPRIRLKTPSRAVTEDVPDKGCN